MKKIDVKLYFLVAMSKKEKKKEKKVRSIRFESIVFVFMITFGTFRRRSRHFEKKAQ